MGNKSIKILCIITAVVVLFCIAAACNTEISDETPELTITPTPTPALEDSEPIDISYHCTCNEPTEVIAPHNVQKPALINTKTPNNTFVVGKASINIETDTDIKTLINGYKDTFWTTSDGQIKLNQSVVCRLDTKYDDEGNKTFTFTLHNYLKWNNGEPITAADYVAGIPAEEPSEYIRDIELLDDYKFSVTIDSSYLPYFWEYSLVTFSPVYASEGGQDTPTVTCGPYSFHNFDGSNVTLKRNEHFGVCPEGYIPYFDEIIIRQISRAQSIQMLSAGEIDFWKGIDVNVLEQQPDAADYIRFNEYPRAGYGFLEFILDIGPTQDYNVRLAIAHIIDRSELIDNAFGSRAFIVNGPYSPAQWTYTENQSLISESVTSTVFDISRAGDLLDETLWIYESDGVTLFDTEKIADEDEYYRYNSEGQVLSIVIATDSDRVAVALSNTAIEAAKQAGIKLAVEQISFKELLDHYYNGKTFPDADRRYNIFHLATDFTPIDDKFWAYHSSLADTPLNTNGVRDEDLDNIVMAMRSLNAEQTDEHAQLWLEFQIRWRQVFPALPLYINIYTDAYNNVVTTVPTTAFAGYEDVIMHIAKRPA